MQLVAVAKSLGGEGGTNASAAKLLCAGRQGVHDTRCAGHPGIRETFIPAKRDFPDFFLHVGLPQSLALWLWLWLCCLLWCPSLLFRSGLSLVCSLARVPSRFTCAVRPPLQPWQSDCADPPPWPTSSPNDPHPRHCLRGLGASSETLCGKLCECQCLENPA